MQVEQGTAYLGPAIEGSYQPISNKPVTRSRSPAPSISRFVGRCLPHGRHVGRRSAIRYPAAVPATCRLIPPNSLGISSAHRWCTATAGRVRNLSALIRLCPLSTSTDYALPSTVRPQAGLLAKVAVDNRPLRRRLCRRIGWRTCCWWWPCSQLPAVGELPAANGAPTAPPSVGKSVMGTPMSAADQAIMAAQAPYLDLNERIPGALGVRANQLAGTRIDVAAGKFYIYLTGQIPAAVLTLAQHARTEGINVVIEPATFARAQLMVAAEQLSRELSSTISGGFSIELATDGSGLTVKYPGAELSASAARSVDSLSESSGVPIQVRSGVPAQVYASRDADTVPFYGGALVHSPGSYCTDGFSAHATGSSAKFMIWVAHCPNFADGVPVSTGGSLSVGASDFVAELYDGRSYDLSVIRLGASKLNDGYIYVSDSTDVPIAGYAAAGIPAGGNYCVSGAFGVPNCNVISGNQEYIQPGGRHPIYVIAVSSKAGSIFCSGDSGGPVYYHNSSGYIAAGLVSTVAGYPCGSTGSVSVVASAINSINGLAITTASG